MELDIEVEVSKTVQQLASAGIVLRGRRRELDEAVATEMIVDLVARVAAEAAEDVFGYLYYMLSAGERDTSEAQRALALVNQFRAMAQLAPKPMVKESSRGR